MSSRSDREQRARDAVVPVPRSLFDDLHDFLEARQDVIDGADGPRPNREMTLLRELREAEDAILALREADQRGAAATCTEGASPETGESQNRASDGKLEAQSAPHHPGGQPVAWTTVLSLELAKGAFYASPVNLWAEKGIPIYTHPGGQEKADGKVAGDAGTTVDSPEAARIPLGMVLVPRDRIEGLLEYWNGNPNERAMWDALTHTQEELHAMLAAADEERNET